MGKTLFSSVNLIILLDIHFLVHSDSLTSHHRSDEDESDEDESDDDKEIDQRFMIAKYNCVVNI